MIAVAIGYTPLPQFRDPGPLDFSPLHSALDDWAKSREKNRLLEEAKQIGASLQPAAPGQASTSYVAQPVNRLLSPAQSSAAAAGRDYPIASPGDPSLPAGMRNNNPGNIKYIPGAKYAGLVGPSVNRDQGDPQMVFDTPQNGMIAAADLALRKYQGGKRTATDLIAGNMGWTPGNTGAAANIARTMGVAPDEDLRLDDPQRMQSFLRALTLQEHGAASRGYGDDVYGAAAGSRSQTATAPQTARTASGMNYDAGIRTALQQGNVALATQLQQAKQEAENLTYTRGRQATQDAQAAETHELSTQQARDTLQKNFASRVGAIAQTIQGETDPAKKTAMLKRFVASDPRFGQSLQAYGGDADAWMRAMIAEARGIEAKPQVGRFRPSKQGIVDTVTGQLVPGSAAADAEAPEYGTSPQYFRDKDGNLRIGQLSKAGGMKSVDLPEGATVLPGIDYRDMGNFVEGRDKRTGQVVSTQPKDIAGKESAEEVGKARGQALNAMPAAKTTVDNAFQTIGKLRTHPGLDVGTGASNVFDPRSWIPGTNAYDFQAMNKQAQGQSFMAARDALKGAGQVTDFEGAKGEQAIANLDTAQSREQYLAALDTLERMMQASYDDLQRKAGILPSPASQTQAAPNQSSAVRVNSPEEAMALPPGTQFMTPDGRLKVRP